ncbi:Uma2 family endonuclease [Aquisphaera insulae]|uniref:Uma2 family endonuclease n=1 Tax=Aquisphaera insulae TaxID=2712864 RepID=UPI0013EC74FF|nr:Uma2 family endonuclease [Aquisphaera insulae]
MWTPARFREAVDAGIFDDVKKVELVRGRLVATMVEDWPHYNVASNVKEALQPLLPGFFVERELTVDAGDSLLVPDVLVTRGTRKSRSKLPRLGEILLAIEVADTTLRRDRRLKAPVYTAAGVVIWVVDVRRRQVEAYAGTSAPTVHGVEDSIPVRIDGVVFGEIRVRELFD